MRVASRLGFAFTVCPKDRTDHDLSWGADAGTPVAPALLPPEVPAIVPH